MVWDVGCVGGIRIIENLLISKHMHAFGRGVDGACVPRIIEHQLNSLDLHSFGCGRGCAPQNH